MDRPLRRGWTTGACATAASVAACERLLTGRFPDPVSITLPRGQTPAFPLALEEAGEGYARAGIVKDAGDDPDVTHGLTIVATVRPGAPGSGILFTAGDGVGRVTRPGLPIGVGEPAINPVPRRMMTMHLTALALRHGVAADLGVEIAIPGGADVALKTWNPRLGIVGGLSILGTTGIVVPFSCAAWIHSIHRGIDVARASSYSHVAACTGSTSEAAVRAQYGLPETALLDMGDFAGGLLKYLRRHPIPRLTIAGGFAKLSKLAEGHLDLHSSRSQVDRDGLARMLASLGAADAIVAAARTANTALEVLQLAGPLAPALADRVAAAALRTARRVLEDAPVAVEVLVYDRAGLLIGRSDGPEGGKA